MTELKIHVGEGADAMGRRFVSAWRRAAAGDEVNERHLTFADLQEAAKVLTPKRIALLKEIHRQPAASIRALAQALGRNYKNVHTDVQDLVAAGLLDRDDAGGLSTDYDTISVATAIVL